MHKELQQLKEQVKTIGMNLLTDGIVTLTAKVSVRRH